ncbi:transporter [Streptomyces qinglanensis]|uniref:Transporter n=2 Tax=Streptomyces qinglanensis TaxID=943816 RepID=A0A1E7K0Y2_9ACTN|nr:transporter [Streptomyces qinglanensis]OEV28036.1 transporter [Streptomyces nanshensis]
MPGAVAASADADPLAAYTGQRLAWEECPFTPEKGASDAECARMTVPLDWAAPAQGDDLQVSISRVSGEGDSHGVLLVNPGGPGGHGSSLAGRLAGLRPGLTQDYDIIGMDPRGTGQEGGEEDLVCPIPTSELPQDRPLDARDRSAHSLAEHRRFPQAVARSCERQELTPYVSTWQTAHDMDLVRALLGERRLNYLGYSYGTWLGAKYGALFPSRAGRLVLDSSVNWQGRLQAAFEDFPRIGQRQFDEVYLPWIVRTHPEHIGRTTDEARATWERVRARYVDQGMAADSYDSLFVGMGSELRWLLATLAFEIGARDLAGAEGQSEQVTVPQRLRNRLDDRARAVFGVPTAQVTVRMVVDALGDEDNGTTNVAGTRFTVACGDQRTRSADWYRRLSEKQGPKAPVYGWAYGLSEPCGYWDGAPRHALPRLPVSVARHVLVVQGEFDPQTGYEQATAAAHRAPGISFLAVEDEAFHGQYALGGNACVDDEVERFLRDGAVPDRRSCPGMPLPGEDTVHPVPGPVQDSSAEAATRLSAVPSSPLREGARAGVSAVNRVTR